MLKELIGLISNIVVDKAMKLTIGDCSSIKLLGGFNDNVFETRVDGKEYVLIT
ncbi:hypothetical protein [Alkaliphilus transvaalensis]|uniref:hypothetical protein n=1 Tax=Alkaliphilus transvaalensis TaxID=114628 RepID=UPI0012ECB6FF|nr:hypothetical protein [Alkaliphilus transvaalensis]